MSASLYQTVFERKLAEKSKIDLHFHWQDRFNKRVTKFDMGRQSGKSTAIVRTMSDNHQYDYIVLSHSQDGAKRLADRYKNLEQDRIKYHENTVQLSGNQLSQITRCYANWIDTRSKRKLCIFVEEPMVQIKRILDNLRDILATTDIDYQIFVVGEQ